jgi:hypothetical protein
MLARGMTMTDQERQREFQAARRSPRAVRTLIKLHAREPRDLVCIWDGTCARSAREAKSATPGVNAGEESNMGICTCEAAEQRKPRGGQRRLWREGL